MLLNFNAATVAPATAFEVLPAGWYTGRIVDTEEKPTAAGTGSYLQLEIEIVAPQQFVGRKLWDRLNLKNPNPKAEEIAFQTLSAICHATGVLQLAQSQQLHGIPMEVKVGLSKPTAEYPDPRNEIKGYRSVQGPHFGAAPAATAAPQAMAPQPMAQPVVQPQAQPAQQWQQPAAAAPAAAQPVQQAPAAPAAQPWAQPAQAAAPAVEQPVAQPAAAPVAEQPAWANNAPQQGAPVAQQAAAAPAAGPAPELTVVQQPATDPAAQQAAAAGKAPWQQ